MREILFRAKRIDNGEWAEGYLFDDGMAEVEHYFVGRIVVEPYKGTACDDWDITGIDFCEVNPETLCQYTGLKDKNGNRIWENDIVRIKNSMDEGIGNIEFYGGMWYVDGEPSNSLHDIVEYDDGEIEVIGNIFDTPGTAERRIRMQELENILEEIEQRKARAEKLIVKPPHDKLDQVANDTAEAFIEAYKECQDIIRKHMNDGWIPVEERLPTMEEYQKDDGRFILDDGNRRCAGYFNVYTGRFYSYQHITQYMAELHENNWVIAWRPLPEPYRPERSEE